jgi:hypothetical protein
MKSPNKITGPNACESRQFPNRTPQGARVGQFYRWAIPGDAAARSYPGLSAVAFRIASARWVVGEF